MLSACTPSACEIAGTAVLRMVVSSDSMKKATATSQGSKLLTEPLCGCGSGPACPCCVLGSSRAIALHNTRLPAVFQRCVGVPATHAENAPVTVANQARIVNCAG